MMPLKERKNASTNISQVLGHIRKTFYERLTINILDGVLYQKSELFFWGLLYWDKAPLL
jgi:hypothetical protein